MSSPARLHSYQTDFLARWMPSSARAGVILNPSPGMAGSLCHTSAVGSPSLEPDESFASDFASLPGSADSSYLGMDGFAPPPGVDGAGTDGPVNRLSSVPLRNSNGEVDSVDEIANKPQDLSLMMKLEELRKWQQHMQEQLKAHQLEELLRLQEEQQRMLGMMNEESQDDLKGIWDHGEDGEEQSVDTSHVQEHDDTLIPTNSVSVDNSATEDKTLNDRPIESQKKTFEELLEDQLKLEEQRLKSARQQQSLDAAEAVRAPSKRAFLKRGEGLTRFTNNRKSSLPKTEENKDSKPRPQTQVISRSNSEPAAIQRRSTGALQRLPVQRKTATLNKENQPRGQRSPSQDVGLQSKTAQTKVLGCHQRQNTEGPEFVHPDSEVRQVKDAKNTPPTNPVAKQVDVVKKEKANATRGESRVSGEGRAGSRGPGGGGGQHSFELSFQEKLQRWECNRQLEHMELGEFELLEQAAEELSFSSNSSFVMKVLQMDQLQASTGLHARRLSSTPIKSPPTAGLRRSSSLGGGSMSSDVLSVQLGGSAGAAEEQDGTSAISSCSNSDFEDQEVKTPSFPNSLCFPAQSNPLYDKNSYQSEERFGDLALDESTVTEDEDGRQEEVVAFDDNDTWNDLEDTALSATVVMGEAFLRQQAANETPPPERTLTRKVAESRAIVSANQEPEPPASSQLMVRLFPSLKPKAQNAAVPAPPAASAAPEVEAGQQAQSRLLRERLVELEIEIGRFKKENAAVTKLKQENEKTQENLRKQLLEFEQMKAEQLAKFEEHKSAESRKLQKERWLFEKHALAAKAVPDRKEREEIQMLKQQLSSLQEELRGKESRWASTSSRQRQQIDALRRENAALQDEIHMLEKLRLSSWKKTAAADAERDGEMREGAALREIRPPPAPKGVKFASPLDFRRSSSPAAAQRSSREVGQGATAEIKSSLRRPSGTGCSSSSSSSSRTEEKSAATTKTQDHGCSPDPQCSEAEEPESAEEVITHPDGRVEKVLAGGDHLITFPNGTRKEVSADGQTVKVTFFNGDTKHMTADQRVIYFYAETQTTHVTYPDGMEVLQFPNNQTEKHFPDGRKEITFSDQTVKNLFPDGREESVLTDGTIVQVNPDGTKEIRFNTGQKEIHTAEYKRREYPDGTVKTLYADGRQETHYPTGRIRIKDKDGNVVVENRL